MMTIMVAPSKESSTSIPGATFAGSWEAGPSSVERAVKTSTVHHVQQAAKHRWQNIRRRIPQRRLSRASLGSVVFISLRGMGAVPG